MTTTQSSRPQKDIAQKRSDHVTLRPESGRIVRPPEKIVTLRPQKLGHSVIVGHCIHPPLVLG
jgi:hypothetical protein